MFRHPQKTLRTVGKKRRGTFRARVERLETRQLLSGAPWLRLAADAPTLEERYDYFIGTPYATDSASAATALATGYKTDEGNVAWLPGDPNTGGRGDGGLTTIAEKLRAERGFSIGVASTVPFSHATPAGFVSHNTSRNNYTQIAHEIIYTVQPEVVIGGGNRNWDTKYISAADQAALEAGATAYTYVGRQTGVDGGDALAAVAATVDLIAGEKLFGLFGGAGGNFEYYQVLDTPGTVSITQGGNADNPTLADTVTASLSVLGQDPDGFFVMFEQGDIDWSNHANNYANMIGGVYDLDQAVRAAEAFVNRPGDRITWNNTLMIVTADHSNSYMRLLQWTGKGDLPDNIAKTGQTVVPGVTQVSYSSTNHTNELVNLYARGKGANLFENVAGSWYPGTQIVDNTQVYHVMCKAATKGVDHIILFIGDGMNIEHEMACSRERSRGPVGRPQDTGTVYQNAGCRQGPDGNSEGGGVPQRWACTESSKN